MGFSFTLNLLLEILFPRKCVGCHKVGSFFCEQCEQKITQAPLICPQCQRLSISGITHPLCYTRYSLDGLWSLGVYQAPLKEAIHKLKYQRVAALANVLGEILLTYWARYRPYFWEQLVADQGQDWVIVPVPLHWSRENDRGFNQAALLAQFLAKNLKINYQELLLRRRATRPQVGLDSEERRKNIRGAFSLSNPGKIDFKCLLVDDVWTTGSTIKECCRVLKRAGASKVWAITLAR